MRFRGSELVLHNSSARLHRSIEWRHSPSLPPNSGLPWGERQREIQACASFRASFLAGVASRLRLIPLNRGLAEAHPRRLRQAETLARRTRGPECESLDPSLDQESIGPRPTSDYQHLLQPEEDGDETEEYRQDDAEPA